MGEARNRSIVLPLVFIGLLAPSGDAVAASPAPEVQEPRAPSLEDIVKLRVVYTISGMERAEVRRDLTYKMAAGEPLKMDVYRPPESRSGTALPGVVFVHGGPVPPGRSVKDWTVFISYGQLAAASGFVGVAFNHRFHSPAVLADSAADVSDLITHVRAHGAELGIDSNRIAVWVFSGGGPLLSPFLREPPEWLRALVSYYAFLDVPEASGGPDPIGSEARRRLSPLSALEAGAAGLPPLLIARAGRDFPALNTTVDRFVQAALARNAPLELLNHPAGRHAFDILDDDARSHEVIARTFDFLRTHLR